mmetsp:Transcript_1282/g.1864  ORF Transcript_1282/g.1864 Transcript_1282/m.1864 type:complete len:205 (-) Transcript_1282:435-1049(-)
MMTMSPRKRGFDELTNRALNTRDAAIIRNEMMNWITELMRLLKASVSSVHLAMFLYDNFLSKSKSNKKQGKSDPSLVALVSFNLAAKYEDGRGLPFSVMELRFPRNKIIAMEQDILKSLDFSLTARTSYQMLESLCVQSHIHASSVGNLADLLLADCLMESPEISTNSCKVTILAVKEAKTSLGRTGRKAMKKTTGTKEQNMKR